MIKQAKRTELPWKTDDPFAYGNPGDDNLAEWIDDMGTYELADPYDPAGSFSTWRQFLREDEESFTNNENMRMSLCETYKRIALSPLQKNPLTAHVYHLNQQNLYEKNVIQSIGFEDVLYLASGKETIAIFDEKSMCFLPAPLSLEKDNAIEALMNETECANRYMFYLETVLKSIDPNMQNNFSRLVEEEKKRYGIEKADGSQYFQEKKMVFHNETNAYLRNNPKETIILSLAGFFGRQEDDVFVDNPLIAIVSKDSLTPKGCLRLSDTEIMLAPAKREFDRIIYDVKQDRIEVEAICSNKHYKRIYNIQSLGNAKELDYVVDLNYLVPSHALKIFCYAIPHVDPSQVSHFQLYPTPSEEKHFLLWEGKDADKTWTLVKRTSKVERIEVKNDKDETVASLPVRSGIGKPQSLPRIVSLDVGGMTSTMLMDNGKDQSTGVVYNNIAMPLTPVKQETFEKFAQGALERNNSGESDISWQSMLQFHGIVQGKDTHETLTCHSWEPDYETLASIVTPYTGASYTIANGMGVYYDLKLPLTVMTEAGNKKTEADKEEMQRIRYAQYIASILRPIILASLREGYEPDGNLSILLAYPDTGKASPQYKSFQKAIRMALEMINKQLADENQFIIGKNCFLYSEASATAEYLLVNNDILNPMIACLFLDIGHTTIDLDIRKKYKNVTMSVPYAGNEITFRSLVMVLTQHLDESFPADCFEEKEAAETMDIIKKSLEANRSAKSMLNNVGARLLLSYVFQHYHFSLPEALTPSQHLFRLATQQRIRCTMPCYAGMIAKAIQEGIIDADDNMKFVLAGNGSRAFANTGDSFSSQFFADLVKLVNTLGVSFKGTIELIPNIDSRKESVARGMLYLHGEQSHLTIENKNRSVPSSYYLKILYGSDTEEYQQKLREFKASIKNVTNVQIQQSYEELREKAYNKAFEDYSFESDFKPLYQEYLRLPHDDNDKETSEWNDAIISLALEETTFENVKNIAMQNKQSLIMCFPEIHRLMITSCIVNELIDTAIQRKGAHHDKNNDKKLQY